MCSTAAPASLETLAYKYGTDKSGQPALKPRMTGDMHTLVATIFKIVGLVSVLLLAGVLARRGMRVNYTRKINHFAIFFIPVFVDQQFASETFTDVVYLSVSALGTLGFLVIFLERVRSKVPVFQLMFEGFDRPEDRPHTLLWLWTQYAAGFAVMVPMI